MSLLPFLLQLATSVIILSLFVGGCYLMYSSRRNRVLRNGTSWLHRNGFEIVQCDYRIFNFGIPLGSASRAQGVLRIRVTDTDGRTRKGWLVLGSPFIGMWDPSGKLIWDKEEQASIG
jgi:hypothetical protein